MIEINDPLNSFREYPGPILLLAGPGTGKTYQLSKRINYLTDELGASADEIAVITFTNEAARNMHEKLFEGEDEIPKEKIPHLISTMHSLGNKIIGGKPEFFGLSRDYDVLLNFILFKQ